MIREARLIIGATSEVNLQPGQHLSLLAGNGKDVLFYVGHNTDIEKIVVNDRIDERWGEDMTFVLPSEPEAAGRNLVRFALTPNGMNVWNDAYAATFTRLEPAVAQQVRFMRLSARARLTRDRLTFVSEPVDTLLTRIEAHVLHRRMDALEARLDGES